MEKSVIITGATNGIGKEIARKLVQKGYRVILACRNRTAAINVQNEFLKTFPKGLIEVAPPLEMGSNQNIRSFVDAFGDRPLSLLINNAGTNAINDRSIDGIPLTMQVNYIGLFLLTCLLVPNLLRSETRPKVINIASVMHRFGEMESAEQGIRQGEYKESKLAVVLFGHEFVRRYGDRIDCCNVDPGAVRTKIFDSIVDSIPFSQWMINMFFADPFEAASTTIHAIDASIEPHSCPFYARGMFALSWITSYRVNRTSFLNRCVDAVFSLSFLFLSMIDEPLRHAFRSPLFHKTNSVPPSPASLDKNFAKLLWEATEAFLYLNPSE